MEVKDKLFLMLEEYRALRAEEMGRTRMQHQLYGLGVALGMGLATAAVFAHRPGFFLFLIVGTALLFGLAIALHQFEMSGVRKRLREIEYEMNTRASDRIFGRESDRAPLAWRTDWVDRDALRRNWEGLVAESRTHAERWRDGVRHFRETVRSGPLRPRPYRADTRNDR
jgi:hypothetical protein